MTSFNRDLTFYILKNYSNMRIGNVCAYLEENTEFILYNEMMGSVTLLEQLHRWTRIL